MFRQRLRIPHVLKPHKGNKTPASLLFFDTETHEDKACKEKNVSRQRLNFGYAYATRLDKGKRTREQWCRFNDSQTFFDFVISRTDQERPLYCFAHNLGFDLTIVDFWHWVEREDFNVEYFVLDDPPSFIIGTYNGRKIVWIDTLNYWRTSLKSIGNSVNLPKLDMPIGKATKSEWTKYAKRDVEILATAVVDLVGYIKNNDLGQFGLSGASMSMSTYRHKFMKHEIFIHDNRGGLSLERNAYYGGRVECFWIGKLTKSDVYKLDINSMYPSVMLGKFPCKHLRCERKLTSPHFVKEVKEQGIVAHVKLNARKATYPVRLNHKLCFCRGQFETYLAGPELRRAYFNGDIVSILSYSLYDMKPLFVDYVNYFWKERQRYKKEGKDAYQYFVKIFMNSLYGKFGQLGYGSVDLLPESLERLYLLEGKIMPDCYRTKEQLYREGPPQATWKPLDLDRSLTVRRVNNAVVVKVPIGEHTESFPGIAAYVTSYARELLLKYLNFAGLSNTYYCDTDSLFVNKTGYRRLEQAGVVSATELGKLKLEGISHGATFNCLKDYIFLDDFKRKGIRHDAKQLTHNSYSQIQFEGVKSVLKRGYEPFIDVRTITKQVSRKYDKGTVTKTGHVIPFTLVPGVDPLASRDLD